jgi:hypothetical protein
MVHAPEISLRLSNCNNGRWLQQGVRKTSMQPAIDDPHKHSLLAGLILPRRLSPPHRRKTDRRSGGKPTFGPSDTDQVARPPFRYPFQSQASRSGTDNPLPIKAMKRPVLFRTIGHAQETLYV